MPQKVDVQYRYATIADAELLARLNEQLIRDEGHRNSMTLSELEARMRDWLTNEYQAILFESDREPIGYALFRRDAEHVYLRQFLIMAEFRRQGLGRAAMEWLSRNVWTDAVRIRLDVLIGNHVGIAFWHSVGFCDYCVTMERKLI